MSSRKQLAQKKIAKTLNKVNAWQDRIAEALVILLLCVQPVYLNPERYIYLTGHKFNFFAGWTGAAIGAVLIVWFVRRMNAFRILPEDKLSVADWAVLGFALVTLLSALFSPYKWDVNVWLGIPEPNGRYDGAITQLLYVAVFFIVSRWYKPRERDFLIFGGSSIIVALLGVFQFYGMDFFKLWPIDIPKYYVEDFYNIHFRSTLGNVDIVSTYVCVAVLLCGFLFIRMTSKWRYVWLAASGLNFWLMILAGAYSGQVGTLGAVFLALPFIIESRKHLGRFLILASSWAGAYTLQTLFYDALILEDRTVFSMLPYIAACAALLAGGIVLTVLWKDKNTAPDTGAPVKWKPGVIIMASVLAVGLIGVEFAGRREDGPKDYKDILYQAREILHGRITDEFGTNRVYIWRHALAIFPDYPILGTGPDTFGEAFPAEAQMRYGEPYDKAHNEYIQILVCQGILGLLCYLAFLVALLVKSVPKAFGNPLLMAVLAASAGYAVQAFFNISLPIASQMLWVLAGMLGCKEFALIHKRAS